MTKGTIELKVSRFLYKHQVTLHSTIGVPLAELMFNSNYECIWICYIQVLVKLVLLDRIRVAKQKVYHNTHLRVHNFNEDDTVHVCCFDGMNKWLATWNYYY